ncbi:MAG: sorting protein [Akkermansiaceae bacterium]|nr:sorting protein [Akkermansiaceae bacterium]
MNGPGTETSSGGTTEFSTVNPTPDNRTSPFSEYRYDISRTDDFLVTIRLDVVSSSYNQLDAGLTFSAFGGTAGFPVSDRSNNVAILADRIQFGDGGSPYLMNTTTFHTYSMRYLGGTLQVYVDASSADIFGGTAVPVMSRSAIAGKTPGVIVFGDATNDPNYNSDYIVDYVTVEPIPEPGSLMLAGLGALGLMRRRR